MHISIKEHITGLSGVVISITNCYIRFTLLYFKCQHHVRVRSTVPFGQQSSKTDVIYPEKSDPGSDSVQCQYHV